LQRLGLAAAVTAVPAPGVSPGIVIHQSPSPSASAPLHSTVALTVAEVPRWQTVTSFSGDQGGHSVPFRIRGTRWRVVYGMSFDGACSVFSFLCSAPSAEVDNVKTNSGRDQFDLSPGDAQTQVFSSGPGIYQVTVTPGSDGAS